MAASAQRVTIGAAQHGEVGSIDCLKDDDALVGRFVQGDASAFDEIAARYYGRISNLACRILGRRSPELDDVVQEVFLAAFQQLRRYRGPHRLAQWLMGIAVRHCRLWQRKRYLRQRLARWLFSADSPVESVAEAPLVAAERARSVQQAVEQLPIKYREVMVLFYFEELPAREVAAVLNLSVSAVEVRLHRAREQLKPALEKLGSDDRC